jgi:hypothetical protein
LVIFVAVAAFLIGGPFYVQVLGHESKWLRGWRMYGGRGGDWCFVHYFRYEPDGSTVPLDRFATLSIRKGSRAWYEAREIRTRDQALLEGKELCVRLGAGARVGFSMKCGDDGVAWNVLEQDSGDVCAD